MRALEKYNRTYKHHGSSFRCWGSSVFLVCEREPMASMVYFLGVHILGVLGNGSKLVKIMCLSPG